VVEEEELELKRYFLYSPIHQKFLVLLVCFQNLKFRQDLVSLVKVVLF
jgi:hypothetical protein